ncbi:hypothetical protein HY212_07395 [Candidatus Pacearchaeota archaeon]|nr:hypothetical protein [Candidatus Pacearchaeota archaeon]
MAYLKLFLPVFFLLGLSFVSVFGDTGSITVVSGKSFQIHYDANYVQVLSVQANTQDQGLIFSIQVTNPTSTLELTLSRELIDATNKTGSADFIVLADGAFIPNVEKSSDQTSRTILIQLAPENKELEIIGTSLASSANGGTSTTQNPSSPAQTPTTKPAQQQNQSSQQPSNTQSQQNQTSTPAKPTENTSTQNLPMQKILSKILHFMLPNLPFNMAYKQIIEYSVIASAILILIVVIASLKKSKTKKQIRK